MRTPIGKELLERAKTYLCGTGAIMTECSS